MNIRTMHLAGALEELSRALQEEERAIVAFDADGTLWSDDVGSLVFEYALSEALLHEDASDALGEVLREVEPGVTLPSGSVRRAQKLLELYEHRTIGDKTMAEVQVWAYAGLRETEAWALTETALALSPRHSVRRDAVFALVERARAQGARVVIVSASPEWVVASAARDLGFAPEDVIGGRARVQEGIIEPALEEELPYGEGKVTALRRRVGDDPLVLATGDSGFDLHLLGAARLGLGVGKKPKLLAGLAELSHCFLLEA